jgi:hypothetical protein
MTWRQVYDMCLLEALPKCVRKGCHCTLVLAGRPVTEWEGKVRGS